MHILKYSHVVTQEGCLLPQSPSPHTCVSLTVNTGKNNLIFLIKSLNQDFYAEKKAQTLGFFSP